MRFRLTQSAYVNMPFHIENDPPGINRMLPQFVQADVRTPQVIELPDDISLDSISRTWEPLDDKARAAQAKLAAGVKRPDRPAVDAGTVLDLLAKLPEAEREKLVKAAEAKARQAAADAKHSGTMSDAAHKAAAQTPKA